MKTDALLNPLRGYLRRGENHNLTFSLKRLLKTASLPETTPRVRTEIYLEAIKAMRVLNQASEATHLCDVAVANIPADSIDLLAALKRLRSLLFLDAGDFSSARTLIDETDGTELVLAGTSVVNRNDSEVSVETWLVSTEIALAERDLFAAENYFLKAVERMSRDQSALSSTRISILDKKRLEGYYRDIQRMIDVYGTTFMLVRDGSQAAIDDLRFKRSELAQENAGAKTPNVPLYSKLSCVLGEWNGADTIPGISEAEARRWTEFGLSEKLMARGIEADFAAPTSLPISLAPAPVGASSDLALAPLQNGQHGQGDLVEQMTKGIVAGFKESIPELAAALRRDTVDYSKRHFGGHILESDVFTLLHNAKRLNLTGFIKFSWSPELFESAVLKGLLPEIVRSGEAYLYLIKGVVIDAAFQSQLSQNTKEAAQNSFILLARLCFSIKADDVRPDILVTAVSHPAVAERPRLMDFHYMDTMKLSSELDEMQAGLRDRITLFDEIQAPEETEYEEPAVTASDDLYIIVDSPKPVQEAASAPEVIILAETELESPETLPVALDLSLPEEVPLLELSAIPDAVETTEVKSDAIVSLFGDDDSEMETEPEKAFELDSMDDEHEKTPVQDFPAFPDFPDDGDYEDF